MISAKQKHSKTNTHEQNNDINKDSTASFSNGIKAQRVQSRVAELGSLLSGAKMAMKIFVKRVFTIFATNASFLRVIANLQI